MPGPGPRSGGPRGPMGGGPSVYINGRAINRFAQPAGGKSLSPTNGPIESVAVYASNIKRSMKYSIKKRGALLGTLTGIRHMLTNSLHMGSFNRKLVNAEKDFKKGKITEQQLALRRMRAAGDYYTYLRKIGYYDDMDVSVNLQVFADSIGVDYVDDNLRPGRTR